MTNEDHSDNFNDPRDHDTVAAILSHFSGDPVTYEQLRKAMHLDKTDAEVLTTVKTELGENKLEGDDIDEHWKNFKGDFGQEGEE